MKTQLLPVLRLCECFFCIFYLFLFSQCGKTQIASEQTGGDKHTTDAAPLPGSAQDQPKPSSPLCRTTSNPFYNPIHQRFAVTDDFASAWDIWMYANRDAACPQTEVTHAVIVIHGAYRNADYYYRIAYAALLKAPDRSAATLLIAPRFPIESEWDGSPASLYWNGGSGWKKGDQSAQGVSSFTITDRLIEHLADKNLYPNLMNITVVGHSAGGQYVHRYAAGSPAEDLSGLPVTYVVASPSSYLYPSADRCTVFAADGCIQFGGFDITSCYGFNRYHYGLAHKNVYMELTSESTVLDRLSSRDIIYLVGEDDDYDDGNLDIGCEANAQGSHRLQRALAIFDYMETFSPDHASFLFTIPSVAHSFNGLAISQAGQCVIFDKNCEETYPAK